MMKANNYEFLVASDTNSREGIGIELWEDDQLVLEIFKDDRQKTKTITFYKKHVSLELMEKSISFFSTNVPKDFID